MMRTLAGRTAPLVFCAILGGCTAGTATEPAPPPVAAGPCRPADFASLKGQDESVLAATTFPQGLTVRVIHPGDAVTMDFSDTRVNILLDWRGIIRDITCG